MPRYDDGSRTGDDPTAPARRASRDVTDPAAPRPPGPGRGDQAVPAAGGRLVDGDWRADDVPGTFGTVMAALRFLTRLVEVNLLVVIGTLAGGVLFGLGPALRAGSAVLHDPGL